MAKSINLALTLLGVLSLSSIQGHHISSCDFEAGNCSGYYYEDINAAFVNCFDENSVPVSRKEAFFASQLQSQCNQTDASSFMQSLGSGNMLASSVLSALMNGSNSTNSTNSTTGSNSTNNSSMFDNSTGIMDNSTNVMNSSGSSNNTIAFCDYYLEGEGYQFTQAESNIGLVILNDRFNTSMDLQYKNGGGSSASTPAVGLQWNWSELTQLVEALVGSSCSGSNSTNSTSSSSPSVVSVLAGLNVPWSQWGQLAQGNLNVTEWTKSELKLWIENYVVYWNAIQAYVKVGQAAINGIGSVVGSLLGNFENQISSGINDFESVVSQGASLIFGGANINGSISFTQFWQPGFDFDNVTIGDIRNDISSVSNIINQVEGWFTMFFVNGGIDSVLSYNTTVSIVSGNTTTNFSTGSSSDNVVVVNVPQNIQAVIAWITANFNSEIKQVFAQYNLTISSGQTQTSSNSTNSTGTGSGSGSGSGSNTTSSFSWSVNYTLPSGCFYNDSTNLSISCSSGNSRGVSYTFTDINDFWNLNALDTCTDVVSANSQCQSNSAISDVTTCLRLSLYNVFQQDQDTPIYGWLSYDAVARNALFGRCQSESDGFNVSSVLFSEAFTYNFPNID